MRLIIFLALLLLSASCRSHKEAMTEVSAVSSVEAQVSASTDSIAAVLDLFHSDFDLDLSGITISLVHRDTIIPDTTAVPVIHIDRARLSGSSDAATVKSTQVSASEADAISEDSSAESSHKSVSSIERPSSSGWIAGLIIVAASILIGGYLLYRIYRIRSPT